MRTFDATDPAKPELLQEFQTGDKGNGTHMNFYDGGKYAYSIADGTTNFAWSITHGPLYGLLVVDMTDPANIKEVSRWWVPGQRLAKRRIQEVSVCRRPSCWSRLHGAPVVPVRVEDGGTIGYSGWGHFGMFIHDLSDITKPKVLGRSRIQRRASAGSHFIPCYPLKPINRPTVAKSRHRCA